MQADFEKTFYLISTKQGSVQVFLASDSSMASQRRSHFHDGEEWSHSIAKMKTNLLSRSVENQFIIYRHDRRENEMLEDTFSLFQRHIRLIDHNIHMTERWFKQHAKRKPLWACKHHYRHYRGRFETRSFCESCIETITLHRNVTWTTDLVRQFFRHVSKIYRRMKEKRPIVSNIMPRSIEGDEV